MSTETIIIAQILNEVYARTVLPLGPVARK